MVAILAIAPESGHSARNDFSYLASIWPALLRFLHLRTPEKPAARTQPRTAGKVQSRTPHWRNFGQMTARTIKCTRGQELSAWWANSSGPTAPVLMTAVPTQGTTVRDHDQQDRLGACFDDWRPDKRFRFCRAASPPAADAEQLPGGFGLRPDLGLGLRLSEPRHINSNHLNSSCAEAQMGPAATGLYS